MGAEIHGDDTSTLRVRGVPKLHGAIHSVIPDRIEAGTFLIAGAITGANSPSPIAIRPPGRRAREAGDRRRPRNKAGSVHSESSGREKTCGIRYNHREYPGFATDMQAQYMALASQAEGTSVITETIFENRFLHASEMIRMGATSPSTAAARWFAPRQLSGHGPGLRPARQRRVGPRRPGRRR